VFFSVGSVVESIHPNPVEVEFVLRKFVLGVDQQDAAGTDLRMHFELVIGLPRDNEDDEGVLAVKIAVGISFCRVGLNRNKVGFESLILPEEMVGHEYQYLSATVEELRQGLSHVWQLILPDFERSEMHLEFMVIFHMEVIIEDEILHPASQPILHRLQNRVVLTVTIR
jgi:hypothetical protein